MHDDHSCTMQTAEVEQTKTPEKITVEFLGEKNYRALQMSAALEEVLKGKAVSAVSKQFNIPYKRLYSRAYRMKTKNLGTSSQGN